MITDVLQTPRNNCLYGWIRIALLNRIGWVSQLLRILTFLFLVSSLLDRIFLLLTKFQDKYPTLLVNACNLIYIRTNEPNYYNNIRRHTDVFELDENYFVSFSRMERLCLTHRIIKIITSNSLACLKIFSNTCCI